MTSAGEERTAIVALTAIAALSLVPFWATDLLPAADHPAHLARLDLLTRALAGSAANPHWRIVPELLPNLAIDLTVPPLALLLGVERAFRVVISVVALLPLVGAAMLQRALFGRVGFGAVLAGAFVFHATLTFGFYNAAAGTGLAIIGLATWIGLAERPVAQVVAMLALSSLTWLCHAFAFLLAGLAIGVWELARAVRGGGVSTRATAGRLATVGLAFLPGLVGLAVLGRETGSGPILFDPATNLLTLAIGGADDGRHGGSLVVLPAVAVLLLAGFREGFASIAPGMKAVVAALLAAALLLPEAIAGGSNLAARTAPAFWTVLVASLRFDWSARAERRALAAAVVLAGLQAGMVARVWRGLDGEAKEFRAALAEVLPEGGRVLPVGRGDDTTVAGRFHLVDLAIVDRNGSSPIFFALAGQQIVRPSEVDAGLVGATTLQLSPASPEALLAVEGDLAAAPAKVRLFWPWLADWSCRFDVVAHLRGTAERLPADPRLEKVRSGAIFDLYRVRPPARCRG